MDVSKSQHGVGVKVSHLMIHLESCVLSGIRWRTEMRSHIQSYKVKLINSQMEIAIALPSRDDAFIRALKE